MEKTPNHFIVIRYLLFVFSLLIPCSAHADVHVHGEGTYTGDQLNIRIYADITSPTRLRSAGLKVIYDPTEMIVANASKNEAVWFIDNEPTMAPDTDNPGEVVVLTFKLDSMDPPAGVSGQQLLIGAITFIPPPAQATIPPTPTLGLDYGKRGSNNQFTNFVDASLGALDDTAAITLGSITLTGPGGPEIAVHVFTHNGTALEGVPVYAFTEAGAYTGISAVTDETGMAYFNPADFPDNTYLFRADHLGSQFWSDGVTVIAGGSNAIDMDLGGGILSATVDQGEGTPLSGISVYLFNGDGTSYLGRSHQTDIDGLAAFEVCSGAYIVRADYLGYQFWSAQIDITEDADLNIPIPHQDVTITVQGDYDGDLLAIESIPVYLFTPEGAFLGQTLTTDAQGQVIFHLPEKDYKVRADHLSQQFWSQDFIWTDETVFVNEAEAVVTMTAMGLGVEGVNVYVFNSTGAYLGLSDVTDANGETLFRLPAGDYNFRGDYLGSQYWSNISTLIPHVQNPVTISAGGGAFTLTALKGPGVPMVDVKCYLFSSSGAFLGENENTSSAGQAVFNLAEGHYKIRIDHMGYQFWTPVFTVPNTLSMTHTIPHQDVMITVQGDYNGDIQVLDGVKVYLFTSNDTYLGLNETTDSLGRVVFNVPEEAYQVRADYLSGQYWSRDFTWTHEAIFINEGMAEVQVLSGGAPMANVPVHVFTDLGSSLGINAMSDPNGMVSFRLPENNYRFRADHLGAQYWATEPVMAHQVNEVTVDTGGGAFTLTVEKRAGVFITGIPVYAFTSNGSYLGLNAQTDAQGRVSFDLADGDYKFRADYLGYQFWTGVSTLPTTYSDVLIIAHQDVTIAVESLYQGPAAPIQGVRVYLFKESGAYLGQYADTDALGAVIFNLPGESYKVRADYLGNQFWSAPFVWGAATVSINQGLAKLHVVQAGVDVVDAPVYLFTGSGSYMGWNERTDALGEAEFLLPDQIYKFRIDYNGAQYWSGDVVVVPGVENGILLDFELL